jgi:hypothetical protein
LKFALALPQADVLIHERLRSRNRKREPVFLAFLGKRLAKATFIIMNHWR